MASQDVDLEKQPFMKSSPIPASRTSNRDSTATPLVLYQTLVGDVSAKVDPNDDSLYHEVVAGAYHAKRAYFLYGAGFFLAVVAQIVLCLGIAAGAQFGLSMNAITIMASVNTGVAASIAAMKALGVPEKQAVERHRLEKIADRIRFTTRKLRAGLVIDAAKEAEDVRKLHEEAEDDAELNLGAASGMVPAAAPQKE